jgi:3-hydroxy-9,10-secoandrosta-1,3,5(10)-triene-9,17-dione monooxygenase reductase component
MREDEIDSTTFRNVLGRYPTGVTLVSAADAGGPFAMVIGSFGSVSLDPPLVQFMPAIDSSTWPRIEATGSYCVNVLGDDQLDLSNSFFAKSADPFAAANWEAGPTGSPIIAGCVAWIDCEIDAVHRGGDHLIVIGAVKAMGEGDSDAGPLLFLGGKYGRHVPLVGD